MEDTILGCVGWRATIFKKFLNKCGEKDTVNFAHNLEYWPSIFDTVLNL